MVRKRANITRNAAIEFTGTGMTRAGIHRIRCITLLVGLLFTLLAAAQNVYRWTDEDGKVHYTKALPPHAASIPYDVLSPQGLLLERVTHEKPDPEQVASTDPVKRKGPAPLYSEEEKERIANSLLLLKYHSENEILDAMQVEVDQLKYDMRLLEADRNSVVQAIRGEIHMAANRQRAGMDVTAQQRQNIEQLRRRLVTNAEARSRLNSRESDIRQVFEAEIERYRRLVAEQEQNT